MLELILMGGTALATFAGYLKSRHFVRDRLRFVDAARKPTVPVIAGTVAALAAGPVVWILPVVGIPTALIFGAGVGWGVHHGQRDLQRRELPPG
jgi:hypothetical protein